MLARRISTSVGEKLAFLLESQYWPLLRLEAYQWQQLTALLKHSYAHVPYYRRAFNEVGLEPRDITSPGDLAQLPILTKEIIREHHDDLLDRSVDRATLVGNSTGGSTGEPLCFFQDENYCQWEQAAAIRAWKYYVGGNETTLEAILWGAERDIGKGMGLKKVLYSVLRERCLPLNTFDLDSASLRRYRTLYNLLRPKILRGYASSLFFVADYVKTQGLSMHPPQAIISSAETLWPNMRSLIEEVFRARVYDSYGCREVSQIATECESHDGLHIVMENQIVELDNGRIVVTNLRNYAMPFIRYSIGDLAESVRKDACACGRSSLRISGLQGRESDNVQLRDGRVIHGEYFTHLFYGMANVRAFCVDYHRDVSRIVVRCNDLTEKQKSELSSRIARDLSLSEIQFHSLDATEKTVTGKFRFVRVISG
jgi:phenylacetate-CoA ligase